MKKTRKIFAVLLSTGITLSSIPHCIVSAEETYTSNITSTLEEDGTIITRNGSGYEYRYTPDINDRTYRTYDDISSVILAKCTDKEAFTKQFSQDYHIFEIEDGRLCVVCLDVPETFTYPGLDSGWVSADAKKAISPLLSSGLVTELTLQGGYHEWTANFIPTVGTMTAYSDRELTDSDFSWLNSSDYELNGKEAHIIAGDSGEWDVQYHLMKTMLETMPSIYAVHLQPYMINTIWPGPTYENIAVYTAQPKGDPNNDTEVTPDDAYQALCYYAKKSIGAEDAAFTDNSDEAKEAAAFAATDVNGDGIINGDDAYLILKYYAEKSVGKTPSWD